MAIQRAAARVSDLALERSVAVAIHIAEAMIGHVGDAVEIDHDAKREVTMALDALLVAGGHAGVVVSAAAVPFLQRGWDLEAISPIRRPGLSPRRRGDRRTATGRADGGARRAPARPRSARAPPALRGEGPGPGRRNFR